MLPRTVTARVIIERAGCLGLGRGWGQSTTRSYFPGLNNSCSKDCWFYASSLGLIVSGAHWRCRNQKRESEGWSLKLHQHLYPFPHMGENPSQTEQWSLPQLTLCVLKHLEELRNGNRKGRDAVGMTELEGIKSEAPGCSVTPEKIDRHNSYVTLFQTAHLWCQKLQWETSELCVLGFGLCTPGLGIWLVSRTQSLCNFAIALFSPIFSSCYTFPVGHWVSLATLLSLANSCTVQNHWGGGWLLFVFTVFYGGSDPVTTRGSCRPSNTAGM